MLKSSLDAELSGRAATETELAAARAELAAAVRPFRLPYTPVIRLRNHAFIGCTYIGIKERRLCSLPGTRDRCRVRVDAAWLWGVAQAEARVGEEAAAVAAATQRAEAAEQAMQVRSPAVDATCRPLHLSFALDPIASE